MRKSRHTDDARDRPLWVDAHGQGCIGALAQSDEVTIAGAKESAKARVATHDSCNCSPRIDAHLQVRYIPGAF